MKYENLSPDDHGRIVKWTREGKVKKGKKAPAFVQHGILVCYNRTHAFVTFKDVVKEKSIDAKASIWLADIEFVGTERG